MGLHDPKNEMYLFYFVDTVYESYLGQLAK